MLEFYLQCSGQTCSTTADLLPAIDFKASPNERCFPGLSFPPEQAKMASAELELGKRVLREEHGPDALPVYKQDFVKVLSILWNIYFTFYNVFC